MPDIYRCTIEVIPEDGSGMSHSLTMREGSDTWDAVAWCLEDASRIDRGNRILSEMLMILLRDREDGFVEDFNDDKRWLEILTIAEGILNDMRK